MPYIITTSLPRHQTFPAWPVERRAVATLGEARGRIYRLLDTGLMDSDEQRGLAVRGLADHGGTVGPLPDGTVIEVERVTWRRLEALAGMSDRDHDADDTAKIIAVYNAAQEV